jgi:hypothetical protein
MDHHRLLEACRAVVQQYPHLRTAFLFHNDQFVQLVLRNLDISFQHIASGLDFDTFAGSVDQQAVESVAMGVPPLQFKLVTQSETEHILILQTTHGQFDGISLQETLKDIVRIYHRIPIPPSLSYISFLHHRFTLDPTPSYKFWCEYLQGSSLASIDSLGLAEKRPEGEVNHNAGDSLVISFKTLPMPTPPAGFTMSTLVDAVYSLTLAQLTGQKDLIFFQIANGRSLPIPEIENTRGCCTNLVPIRAAIQPAWTGLDLLRHLRRQKIQTLPHDFVFWDDIAENCTRWPRHTPPGAVLLYQNIELEPRISIGDFEYRMREIDIWNVEQIGACVVPRDGHLICYIASPSRILSQENAEIIANQFVNNLLSITQHLESSLP